MVEVILICNGISPPHEFKRTFDKEIDWSKVNQLIQQTDPRCELHPAEIAYCDWE